MDFSQFIWNPQFELRPSGTYDLLYIQCCLTHEISCSSSSWVLCDFIEVKDLEKTESGTRSLWRTIHIRVSKKETMEGEKNTHKQDYIPNKYPSQKQTQEETKKKNTEMFSESFHP